MRKATKKVGQVIPKKRNVQKVKRQGENMVDFVSK